MRVQKLLPLGIATALGAGFSPLAPGTMGTLVAIPLVWWTGDWDFPARAFFWLTLLVLGTWSARWMDREFRSSDNQKIVIDEVVGYAITAWTAGRDFPVLALAFVFFRLFDVTKPPPVRQIDAWSKKKAALGGSWWGAFGVMADDLVAGILGLFVILAFQQFGWL